MQQKKEKDGLNRVELNEKTTTQKEQQKKKKHDNDVQQKVTFGLIVSSFDT